MKLDTAEPIAGASLVGTSPFWVHIFTEGNVILRTIVLTLAAATGVLVFIREIRRHRREVEEAKWAARQHRRWDDDGRS